MADLISPNLRQDLVDALDKHIPLRARQVTFEDGRTEKLISHRCEAMEDGTILFITRVGFEEKLNGIVHTMTCMLRTIDVRRVDNLGPVVEAKSVN